MRTKRNRRFTGVRNMNHKPEIDDSVRYTKALASIMIEY